MPSNISIKNINFLNSPEFNNVNVKNTGSPEYQIATLTYKINYLSYHVKKHSKDYSTKSGLLILVNRRKKIMSYLQSKNPEILAKIAQKLDIRNTAI